MLSGQFIWAIGHFQQVRPRTFMVPVAASIAVHSLHNGFFYLWPWYAKYQASRPVTG